MGMSPSQIMQMISGGMAGAGGLMSLFGKTQKAQTTQLPTMTPEQQQWQSQAGQMAMKGLQDPTAGFDPIAQQARSQFQTQTMPSLAERFTSFGQGAQRGSDFMGAAAGAGSELEESLAAQKAQYGLQNQGQLQNLLGIGMRPSFDNIYQPAQMGGMQRIGAQMFGGGMDSFGQSMQASKMQKMIPMLQQLFASQGGR